MPYFLVSSLDMHILPRARVIGVIGDFCAFLEPLSESTEINIFDIYYFKFRLKVVHREADFVFPATSLYMQYMFTERYAISIFRVTL